MYYLLSTIIYYVLLSTSKANYNHEIFKIIIYKNVLI